MSESPIWSTIVDKQVIAKSLRSLKDFKLITTCPAANGSPVTTKNPRTLKKYEFLHAITNGSLGDIWRSENMSAVLLCCAAADINEHIWAYKRTLVREVIGVAPLIELVGQYTNCALNSAAVASLFGDSHLYDESNYPQLVRSGVSIHPRYQRAKPGPSCIKYTINVSNLCRLHNNDIQLQWCHQFMVTDTDFWKWLLCAGDDATKIRQDFSGMPEVDAPLYPNVAEVLQLEEVPALYRAARDRFRTLLLDA